MDGPDHVDELLARWAIERPDLDTSPVAIFARVTRAAIAVDRVMADVFSPLGLNRGEFDVLVSLRRAGPPYRLNPTQLAGSLLVTSGAMTNRVDRLERAGLVARRTDPGDRRGVPVELTAGGKDLADRALEALVARERELLDDAGIETLELARELRRLLSALEARLVAPTDVGSNVAP
jgi:DNA-binding MarR family transcriptional regulator